MEKPTENEARNMLFGLLERTLLNEKDILKIKENVMQSAHSLPMKGVSALYDKMEKKLSDEDRNRLEILMYFFGP